MVAETETKQKHPKTAVFLHIYRNNHDWKTLGIMLCSAL